MSLGRVDSHQHFTREYLPALLAPILKRNRFDGTVVVSPSEADNRWLLEQADQYDFIRGIVCSGLTQFEEFQAHSKVRGVQTPIASGDFTILVEHDLALDVPPQLDLIPALAQAHPALRIAIDSVGRPSLMQPYQPDQLAALARYPNVFVKISGLITDAPTRWNPAQFAPWVRTALAAFGPERVMYGSDWPSYLPEGTWKEALAAFTQALGAQTLETREYLLGGTARRFYRLGDAA